MENNLGAAKQSDRLSGGRALYIGVPHLSCPAAMHQTRFADHRTLLRRADEIGFQFGRRKS
jgi:hypothetical protein